MPVQSTRVERRCEQCGTPFLIYPSHLKKQGAGRFCSRPCTIKARGSAPRAHRQPPTFRPCERCGVPFRVYPSAERSGMGRYCSRECSQLSRRDGETKTCPVCGASFYARRRRMEEHSALYCGQSCEIADRRRAIEDRFWERVNKDGPTPAHRPELGPCWVWTGYLNWQRGGYGYIGRGGRGNGTLRAHRYSWEFHNGPIPEGMEVLHHCDNPPCVRPDHLFLGDQQANVNDMWAKDRGPNGARMSKRLTDDDVREIRRLWETGQYRQVELARQFGSTTGAVSAIVRRRSWKHIA